MLFFLTPTAGHSFHTINEAIARLKKVPTPFSYIHAKNERIVANYKDGNLYGEVTRLCHRMFWYNNMFVDTVPLRPKPKTLTGSMEELNDALKVFKDALRETF